MNRDVSYLDQISNYLKKNLKKGYTKESLKWALVGQGHSKLEIEKAFNRAEKELSREAPVLRTKPKITYEVIDSKPEKISQESDAKKKKSFLDRLFGDD
jgi:hypothetical protein